MIYTSIRSFGKIFIRNVCMCACLCVRIMYWMTDNGRPRTCGDKLDSGSSSAGNGTNLQAKGSMALELLIAII